MLLLVSINVGGKNGGKATHFVKNWQSWVEKLIPTSTVAIFFFASTDAKAQLVEGLFEVHYPFISANGVEDFGRELRNLPEWWPKIWHESDVLLLHVESWCGSSHRERTVWNWKMNGSRLGIFWGNWGIPHNVYHGAFARCLYCNITIRNAKNFDKIGQLLKIKETHNDIFR